MRKINFFIKTKIVSFLEMPIGVLTSLVIFSTLLYLMENPFWKEISFSLLVLNLAPNNRLKTLAFINIVLFFIIELPFISTPPTYKNLYPLILQSEHTLGIDSLILKLVILILLWGIIKLITFFRNNKFFENISFPFLFISCMSFIGLFIIGKINDSFIFILLSCIFVIFSKTLWSYSYALEDYKYLQNKSSFYILATSFNFWTLGMIRFTPVPKGLPHIEHILTSDNSKLAQTKFSGLKLMVWALILKYIAEFITLIFFQQNGEFFGFTFNGFNITNFQNVPISQYISEKHSFLEVWLVATINCLKFLLNELTSQSGMIVATVRMAGFQVFRQTYKPYLAKDMNDWFRRLYHYYNEILLKFFFFPIIRFFAKINLPKKLNIFLSAFITISLGGLIIFISHNPRFFFDNKFEILTDIIIGRLPYFFTIGFFSGLSAILYQRNFLKTDSKPIHIIRLGIIFLIYSFAFASQNRYYMGDIEHKFDFILLFFKFWR